MTKRDYLLLEEVCKRHDLPWDFLLDLANTLHEQNPRLNQRVFLTETLKEPVVE